MTQGSLLDLPTPRQKKRGHVPASSVAAYLERPRDGRVAAVVEWLAACWHHHPTSAELALWRWRDQGHRGPVGTDCLLYVRRGLSEALAAGLVSHAGERKCSVSGRTCLTWRVVGR